jgi:ubiquinone/menaquinone biosynthesis C-methylase UbiE
MSEFSVDQARAFYDRFGRKQDWQRFYEDRAIGLLTAHAGFGKADRVFEFGCGTGRLAEHLLRDLLPAKCRYRGIDVSSTMVEIARQRLASWSDRAEVTLSDGSNRLDEPNRSLDRFVSTYVFDLLGRDQIAGVLMEAHRVLVPEGLLCLVSLTHGCGAVSRCVSRMWERIHSFSPALVGGCRPLDLREFLPIRWRLEYVGYVTSLGLTSQVLIASPVERG